MEKDVRQKLAGAEVGPLINFNVLRLKDGIQRFVL
jgi:hypothetical protein